MKQPREYDSRKKAVAYLRVSTDMQVDGYSIDAQENEIRKYADYQKIDIVETYKDLGKSGRSIEGRPAFLQMMEDITHREIDVVIVFKLSRFGRSAADILVSVQKLEDYKISLVCIKDNIDSSTDSGKLMISVLSAVAEMEKSNIREQTMAGRQQKAREGKWNGGFAPYGYRVGDNSILEIEENEAETIRLIFNKFTSTDMGYSGVAKYLKEQGIRKIPRKNGTLEHWSASQVRAVLDNPVYNGLMPYGRRTKEKIKGTRDDYHQVRQKEYPIHKGLHKAIIDDKTWEEAKCKRTHTGVKSQPRIGRERTHLLSGILKCPECGAGMYTNKRVRKNKHGIEVEDCYYSCSKTKQQRGNCTYKKSLRKEVIEKEVIDAIKSLVQAPVFVNAIKDKIGKNIDTKELDKELEKCNKSVRQCTVSIKTLEDEIDSMPFDAPNRTAQINSRNKRMDKKYEELMLIQAEIETLQKKREAIENDMLNIDDIYKTLENFERFFDKMSDKQKRTFIAYLVREIEVYKPQGYDKEHNLQTDNPTNEAGTTKNKGYNDKNMSHLKSITFQFPVDYNGERGNQILLDKNGHVECVVLMTRA